MQGGMGGQAFVASSAVSGGAPIAYMAQGATTTSRMYFALCVAGFCNGAAGLGGNLLGDVPITFFPSAETTGTNNGVRTQAQLATNHIPVANGDLMVASPTAEFNQIGLTMLLDQYTPSAGNATGGSGGIFINDSSPVVTGFGVALVNNRGASLPTFRAYSAAGSFFEDLQLGFRPTSAVIHIEGTFPTGMSASSSYNIFEDDPGDGVGSFLTLTPFTGLMSYNNEFSAHIVNSLGYQYNGAAPSGHTLCGNGTNYVDSATCGL